MKLKKGLYNVIFGIMGQIITLALGIVIPRLFIVNLGSAANGLLFSIGQVLSYLTLLEAGLGGASIQALYKPLAEEDIDAVNGVLAATDEFYKKTGEIYMACVVGISVIYPLFISEFSYGVTFLIVFLSGIPGALNYYYQGKFRVLLTAEGKSYVISNISTILSVLTSVSKIFLILSGCNLIHLQLVYCAIALLQIIIYKIIFNKSYRWVNYTASPDYNSIKQKKSVLIHQISNLILTNTDIIILTIFTNLKTVSIYTIYNMVFDIVTTSVQTVGNSVSYILAQSYYTDKHKFIKYFDVYETCFFLFSFSLFTTVFLLITPFLKLYTRGVTDVNYLDSYLPILFVVMKLLAASRTPCLNIINAVGLFKETQRSALVETGINLVVSIIAVYNFGIYGVVIGTIAALLYRAVYLVRFAGKNILLRSPLYTLRRWGINICVSTVIVIIEKCFVHYEMNCYSTFFIVAVMYTLIIGLVFIFVDSIANLKETRLVITSLKKMTLYKRKKHFYLL